ncbi:MAG: hypothetical protein VCE74_19950, partial [Alphaproteobacteria bacterium]
YAPQNSPYRAGKDLGGLQDYKFFQAGPEAKQKVIDDLNAQITPWPAYVLTLDETGMGPKDDWGYVAPPDDVGDGEDVAGSSGGTSLNSLSFSGTTEQQPVMDDSKPAFSVATEDPASAPDAPVPAKLEPRQAGTPYGCRTAQDR